MSSLVFFKRGNNGKSTKSAWCGLKSNTLGFDSETDTVLVRLDALIALNGGEMPTQYQTIDAGVELKKKPLIVKDEKTGERVHAEAKDGSKLYTV